MVFVPSRERGCGTSSRSTGEASIAGTSFVFENVSASSSVGSAMIRSDGSWCM